MALGHRHDEIQNSRFLPHKHTVIIQQLEWGQICRACYRPNVYCCKICKAFFFVNLKVHEHVRVELNLISQKREERTMHAMLMTSYHRLSKAVRNLWRPNTFPP